MRNGNNHVMSEYLFKIQLLVSNTEFKNKEIANKYETVESKLNGDAYVRAKLGTDMFESYEWDPVELASMLNELGFNPHEIQRMLDTPSIIPTQALKVILNHKRQEFINQYKEPNKYYVNLMGLPFDGSATVDADPLISVPSGFYELYKNTYAFGPDTYVHTLPDKYMELFLNSDYYTLLLRQYPDVEYLKHLGSYSIPLEISRPAHDGDILLINTSKLHVYHQTFGDVSVSSDLVHLYTTTYEKVHDYVYFTLRGNFEMIYANYNSFIRFLTIYMTIGNVLNECMKRSSTLIYMNPSIMNDYFMLYGLPSVIMDNTDSMVEFLKKFRLLLMDKGTNTVYRVKDIIGYEYTDIYTLIMVKQQAFKNGKPVYYTDEHGVRKPQQEIVFRRFGTAEDNTSYFKFRDSSKTYTLDEITSGDPRWWNTPEVEEMIQTMNYTLSNSKYIQLSTYMSMDDIWWQTSILLRGLLDNREETKAIMLHLDHNINGIQRMSIFDAVTVLLVAMDWKHVDFRGNHFQSMIQSPNGMYDGKPACLDMLFIGTSADPDQDPHDTIPGLPYLVSAFNFDLPNTDPKYYKSLPYQSYLDPDVFIPMLESIYNRTTANIGETMMHEVKAVYKYLRDKLFNAMTIHEFRQVDIAYNHIFLTDPLNLKWFESMEISTDEILISNYGFSAEEYESFKYFLFQDENTINVPYNGTTYVISPYELMTSDVKSLTQYPFTTDSAFVDKFNAVMDTWHDSNIDNAIALNAVFRNQYQSIIKDKVSLDLSNTDYGPRTYEALLLRSNPVLYRGLMSMKSNMDSIVVLIKSIIRALEAYTNSKLIALQMYTLGAQEYIDILKEVISYFKSYMVEFTKDEFTYIFGGPFDNGSESDMLHLYDEITRLRYHLIPRDVLKIHDASHMKIRYGVKENVVPFIYDEAIFRVKSTYQHMKSMGYDIWFDDGNRITKTALPSMSNTDVIVGNLVYNKSTSTYMLIIPKNNVNPDYYYGNTRP